jgi:hypothetical protein
MLSLIKSSRSCTQSRWKQNRPKSVPFLSTLHNFISPLVPFIVHSVRTLSLTFSCLVLCSAVCTRDSTSILNSSRSTSQSITRHFSHICAFARSQDACRRGGGCE